MRAVVWVLLGLAGAVACGKSVEDAGEAAAGASPAAGASTGGSTVSAAAGAGAGAPPVPVAGTPSVSGSGAGGNAAAGAAAGGGAQGGAAQAGNGAAGQPEPVGGATGLVDCDPRKIFCKRVAPTCPAGEVPTVEGSCYGDCVKVESCACSIAEQCPQQDQHTCWMQQHCGPFVR